MHGEVFTRVDLDLELLPGNWLGVSKPVRAAEPIL